MKTRQFQSAIALKRRLCYADDPTRPSKPILAKTERYTSIFPGKICFYKLKYVY